MNNSDEKLNLIGFLLLVTIASIFGMENLRVFFPGLMWSLSRNPPVGQLLGTLLAVFSLPTLTLYLLRSINVKKIFALVALGQVIVRFLEQINLIGSIDFLITSVGIFFFICFFYLAFSFFPYRAFSVGVGVLIGISIDTAIRGSLWTLDLSWQRGWIAIGVVCFFSILQVFLIYRVGRNLENSGNLVLSGVNPRAGYLAIIFCLFIFIQQHTLQDISRVLIITGKEYVPALLYIVLINCLSICVALFCIANVRVEKTVIIYLLPLVLLFSLLGTIINNKLFDIVIFSLSGLLTSSVFCSSLITLEKNKNIGNSKFIIHWEIGFILYPMLVAVYYMLSTPFIVVELISILFILIGFFARNREFLVGSYLTLDKAHIVTIAALPFLLLGSVIIAVFDHPLELSHSEISQAEEIKVMSINLHQGFDANGNMAIIEQVQFINSYDPDIISINEVSRGWLIDGSLDIYVWLSHNLNKPGYFGSALGELNGNAVFSKFPLISYTNHRYLNDGSKLPRAYLQVELLILDRRTTIVSTHLAWDDGGPAARKAEVNELVQKYQTPRTLILGDMNAYPDYETIEGLFARAGFLDGFKSAGKGDGYTWHTLDPVYRLDYIFGSQGIQFVDFMVLDTTVSDHFPILATILIKEP